MWFWYAVWLRVFSELGVPLRYLGASGRFASWALELHGGGNGDRDGQRQRDDRQMHPTSGGVEQLVPAGPIGFRLRRDLLSACPVAEATSARVLARAGQSRWARTPALFDPQLVDGQTPAGARAVQDTDFDSLDDALQASLAGSAPPRRWAWVDAKTFFDDINRRSGQDCGGDGGVGGHFCLGLRRGQVWRWAR